jgi:LPS sulfotransferase NodH
MPPHRSVILCATPRTGSTLVCALFAASGHGGNPESWYRAEDRTDYARDWAVSPDDSQAYLAAVVRAGTGPDGTFGLRIQAATLPVLMTELGTLLPDADGDMARLAAAFGPCHVLRTRRRDPVAQAVSRLKAEQTGIWHHDGTESAPRRPPAYDPDLIDAYIAEARAGDETWDTWFAATGIAPVTIWYEDLALDPPAVVGKAMRDLGLLSDPVALPAVPNRRMADAVSADFAARYRADRGI